MPKAKGKWTEDWGVQYRTAHSWAGLKPYENGSNFGMCRYPDVHTPDVKRQVRNGRAQKRAIAQRPEGAYRRLPAEISAEAKGRAVEEQRARERPIHRLYGWRQKNGGTF